jgi:hypothetical protein
MKIGDIVRTSEDLESKEKIIIIGQIVWKNYSDIGLKILKVSGFEDYYKDFKRNVFPALYFHKIELNDELLSELI